MHTGAHSTIFRAHLALHAAKGFSHFCWNVSMHLIYSDRKTKKRDFRSLWIQRINAATREHGLSYNQFMSGLSQCNISLNRKVRVYSVCLAPTPACSTVTGSMRIRKSFSDASLIPFLS